MKLDTYTFNVGLATEIGLEESIILQHFRYWTNNNASRDEFFREGRVWLYASRKSILETFPFLTDRVIRTALSHLEEGGWIIRGESDTRKGTWFALSDATLALYNGDMETLVKLTKTLVKTTNDININNNINKKEYSLDEKRKILRDKCEPYVEKYGRPMIEAFLNYWGAENDTHTLLACEIAKRKTGTFDIPRRLATWAQNNEGRAYGPKPQPVQQPQRKKKTMWEQMGLTYEEYIGLHKND